MTDAPTGDHLRVTHQGRADASAPTLVLLHGLTDSGDCWPDAVRRWEADYHIVTVDARGHGQSPRWSDDELAEGVAETMREDAVAVLESLQPPSTTPPVLVGHSMGGATAWAVALARPDLVRGIVLEDPAVPPTTAEDRMAPVPQSDDAEASDLHHRGPWDWPQIEIEPWETSKHQVDERMLATGVVCLSAPWPQVWAPLDVPTLVVTGTDKVIIDAQHRTDIDALGNPRIGVSVVAHADHCVRRCNPHGYHAVVDPFLAQMS